MNPFKQHLCLLALTLAAFAATAQTPAPANWPAPVSTATVITNTAVFGAVPEVWEFNVDAKSDTDALIAGLQKAEASGQRSTLEFRQDKGKWWACSSIEYYVTGLTK